MNFENFYHSTKAREYDAKEAYNKNVIVFRCVNLLASTASHVPLLIHTEKETYKTKDFKLPFNKKYSSSKKNQNNYHPIQYLLKYPNDHNSGFEFMYEIIASKLLFGNSYILIKPKFDTKDELSSFIPSKLLNSSDNVQYELKILDQSKINVITNNESETTGYSYKVDETNSIIYPINLATRDSQILHIKNYNPDNKCYGTSILKPVEDAISLHNMSMKWNTNLLSNGARPSGALMIKNNSRLSQDEFERLRSQLNENYQGCAHSGKPLLLEGGLEWKEMSLNPKDMDFIESKNSASREIALAFGIPPQLLGINGDNTYSNFQEARLALWEETLIPILDYLSDAFTNWFSKLFNQNILISFDYDQISALIEKRQNLWQKLNDADFMTIDEKRHMVGLPPLNIQNSKP